MAHEKIGETVEELEQIARMLRRRVALNERSLEIYKGEISLVEKKIERLKKEGNENAQS